MIYLRPTWLVLLVATLLVFNAPVVAQPKGEFIQPDNLFPKVRINTSLGSLVVELDRMKAPLTVNNFLSYVVAKRYDNTVFHRLEHDFVLQGGGYTTEMESVTEFSPIVNESGNGLKNEQFSISMARQYTPHSATSQFFFNLADNKSLDPGRNWGYAVFGAVVEGEELFEKLYEIETGPTPELGWPSLPNKQIVIKSAEIVAEN